METKNEPMFDFDSLPNDTRLEIGNYLEPTIQVAPGIANLLSPCTRFQSGRVSNGIKRRR